MYTLKIILISSIFLFIPILCAAQSMDFELSAGDTSVAADVGYRKPLPTGYMKVGLSGVYTDDDSKEYQWGGIKLLVGNDYLQPGLSAEIGVKALLGSAEENQFSGDIGLLAFTGRAGYLFPRHIIPVPLQIFGGLSYAPDPLTFIDAERFLELELGVGLRIMQNASVMLSLHSYDIDFDEEPTDWSLDDEVLRLSLVMHF
jgi:hypothetical protein